MFLLNEYEGQCMEHVSRTSMCESDRFSDSMFEPFGYPKYHDLKQKISIFNYQTNNYTIVP
jgi:hypothetical protein